MAETTRARRETKARDGNVRSTANASQARTRCTARGGWNLPRTTRKQ